jgi:hypothetical protein
MTNQQPEALRLAKCLEVDCDMNWPDYDNQMQAAAELRRLHAENENLRAQLGRTQSMDRIRLDRILELEGVIKAVHKLHAARGRYHTQLAACDLFELCGLPAERPKK